MEQNENEEENINNAKKEEEENINDINKEEQIEENKNKEEINNSENENKDSNERLINDEITEGKETKNINENNNEENDNNNKEKNKDNNNIVKNDENENNGENENNNNEENNNENNNNDENNVENGKNDENIESEKKENIRYTENEDERKVEEEEENDENDEKKLYNEIGDESVSKGEKTKIRKLPKILKLNKSLTEGSGNQLTTIGSENLLTKESSEYIIARNKIQDFCNPKIRNKYYYNLKSLDHIFKTKRIMIEQNKKLLKKKELTDEERELEALEELRKIKNPINLTQEETKKYLSLYNCDEIEENIMDLKASVKQNQLYKSDEFNTTKFNEYRAFKIFYNKMKKDTEIFRKGGENIKTPSFNLIRATNKYRVVPNPIGVVKRKGEPNKLELNNRLVGDNYLKCICESLQVSDHITEINLKKNRLSDFSIIPLFNTIIKNSILLKQIVLIDLSYNKIGFAATELICQYMAEYNCSLEHLNLESNNLGNNNAKKIIDAIYTNLDSKIRYLNLGQNLLDDEVSTDLTTLIQKSEYLTVLILYQNQFRNKGAGLMMSEIKKHLRLKILDLSWNLIGTNLIDEIPTLDELTKASKDPKNHFDNAYLNELKYTLEFRRPGSLSPVRLGSKVSYFVTQLCELFHNKNTELLHLDISYNNINVVDATAISENIKDNHTILGIHVDGNDMWVDELGFVFPIEKSKYKQNHFANSQIFYRIANDHPLNRSSVINVQKLRSKNNCWICEGWREIKFHYKPNKFEGNLESAYVRLHLNFENYKSFNLKLIGDSFVCHRMCPSGFLNFFLTMNGIPVDNYGPITHELKDAIIYTQEEKPKEYEDEEDDEEEKELKKFIITKVAQTNVEINPEVISSDGYIKMIKYCVPRPEKNNDLKKRPRTPWSFPASIWAFYGYDINGEPESVYNNAFEFDYNRCNFGKDKDISTDEEFDLKTILRNKYKQMIETYKNLSAYLGWKVWQIGQNQITEFVSSCPDLLDKNYLINDVLVKVTEVKSNAIDKQDRKKNQNIPDNIIRHQFMMLLVKIAKDKYFRTKQIPSVVEAVDYSFEHHYDFYLNQFKNNRWREERYYNEEVDNILKAFVPIFDALFYSYAPQQIMGRKDSFWLTLDGYTNLCNNLMDSDFPVKELPILFSLSIRLTTNEIDSDKHYNMIFPEFLEAISRFIDKLSPIPPGEDSSKWDMKKRQEQPLVVKIETMIPQLMRLISGQYKNVRDKFVMPGREEDTGLFKIDYDNPLYEGKIPKRIKKKKV